MNTLFLSEKAYEIPAEFNELSQQQIKTIAYLMAGNLDDIAMQKLFFVTLTNQLPFFAQATVLWFYFYRSTLAEKADMLMLTRDFSKDKPFTAQKFKKLRVKNVQLFGPSDELGTLTFFEFITAENFFFLLNTTDDPKWLNMLIACLYRPQNPEAKPFDDDQRIPHSEAATAYSYKLIKNLDHYTKTSILMWFDGCRMKIIAAFPMIFKKKKETSTSVNPAPQWANLMIELAESMDKVEAIGNTNLYTAMANISKILKQQEKS